MWITSYLSTAYALRMAEYEVTINFKLTAFRLVEALYFFPLIANQKPCYYEMGNCHVND